MSDIETTNQEATRATRTTISLGDLKLDVLQFPDGSYHFFINQLNEVLRIKASDTTGQKYLKPLLDANPNQVRVASVVGSKTHLKTLSLSIVVQAIQAYAAIGNKQCLAVAIASLSETLERRADQAFGVTKTEAERQVKFKYIFESVTRDERVAPFLRLDTTAKGYGGTYLAKTLTMMINKAVFNVDNFNSDRDNMTPQQQAAVCHLEKNIMSFWLSEPEKTATGFVRCYDKAIADFTSVYGNQFHQEEPKRRVYKSATAQAKQIEREHEKSLSDTRLALMFNHQYR